MSALTFIEDAKRAGRVECFNKVLDRWPSLGELEDHGALVGMEILERISKLINDKHLEMTRLTFESFLRTKCESELRLLKKRADSYSSDLASSNIYVPALTVDERRERMMAYDGMDFCDDFETYCEYYGLPYHKFGEVHGSRMLQEYVKSLGSL